MLEHAAQSTPDPSEGSSNLIVPRGPEAAAPYPLSGQGALDGRNGDERAPDSGAAAANLLATLLRAKWLILGVFVVVSGATLPFIWLKMQPTYRATAAIRVRPVVPRLVFRTEANSGVLPLYGAFLNTQVNMIQSNTVLERVLSHREVRETTWYQRMSQPAPVALGEDGPPGERRNGSDEETEALSGREKEGGPSPFAPPTIEALRESLSVAAVGNTELIEVSMTARDPRDATVIANAVVHEYLYEDRESVSATEVEHTRILREKMNDLERAIRAKTDLMYDLSEELDTLDPELVLSQKLKHYEEMKKEAEALELNMKLTQMELDALTQREKGDSKGGETKESRAGWAARYEADAEWQRGNIALQETRRALSLEESKGLGPKHSKIQTLRAAITNLEQQIRAREGWLRTQGWAPAVAAGTAGAPAGAVIRDRPTLEHLLARQKQELNLRNQQITSLGNELANVRKAAEEVARLDEQIEAAKNKYKTLLRRLDEKLMEQQVAGRIDIASEAVEPTRPFKDRRKRLSLAATGGGLVLGIALSLVLSSMNPRVHRPDDVQGSVRVPFLGQLPPFPEDSDILSQCDPILLEGTRMVRTALLRRIAGTGKQVILVTSPCTDDGKTSLALLLARSLASLGKRTLLVEGDFRRPALSRRLKLESRIGLASLLLGTAKEDRAILSTGIAGFDVLLVGERPVDFDPELLANGVFASCLSRWKKRYDYILVDSSPVLPVADARIVAGQADGTIMVLRASRSRRAEVVQAYADLSATGGSLLGTVLVGSMPDLGGHYEGEYGLERAALSTTERRS